MGPEVCLGLVYVAGRRLVGPTLGMALSGLGLSFGRPSLPRGRSALSLLPEIPPAPIPVDRMVSFCPAAPEGPGIQSPWLGLCQPEEVTYNGSMIDWPAVSQRLVSEPGVYQPRPNYCV